MANSIIMPKTGMAMEEGIILEWRIKVGDKVAKGDIVALIETDKSTMELESDYDGVVLSILNKDGETVPVTKVIAWIGQSGEAVPSGALPESAAKTGVSAETSLPKSGAGVFPEASGSVSPGPKDASGKVSLSSIGAKGAQFTSGQGVRATPAARTLAKEKGINLKTLVPQGRYGEIRIDTVKAALEANAPLSAQSMPKETAMQRTAGDLTDKRVPLTNIQKITGKRMSESRQTIPEVTSHIKVDVTEMLILREELNNSLSALNMPGKITINDFVLAAAVKTLLTNPRLNSALDGNELIYKGSINVGMAAATKRGLVVPVIHNAQNYSLTGLSNRARELADKAREGTLKPEEMSGGTFTVSNIGMYGIVSFTPIINPPEAAILGVCAVEDELALDGEKIINRKKMGLSLAYDHRIVDGAESSLFLKELKENLEAPLSILV